MQKGKWCVAAFAVLALLALGLPHPADADLSAFVGTAGFDKDANLDRSFAFGVRWGKSSGIIGGETSLLIARPGREFDLGAGAPAIETTATAFFYEGRLLINIPVGQVKPFVGIGLGQIVITKAEPTIPAGTDAAVEQAVGAVGDLQTNNAFSYGCGVRYALNDRLSVRGDLRQYVVFSVTGLAAQQVASQADVDLTDDSTVQYNELTIGLNIKL